MAFCKFSSEYILSTSTNIDNIFINEFLPYCDPNFAKIYIFGLYRCNNSASYDNTLENFANCLKLSTEEVLNGFKYWENEGLVQLLNISPIEVRYLPITNVISNIKKFNKTKYSSFNKQIQEIIEGRMISPNEYAQYYTVIETYHMECDALLMIAKYCTNLKGNNLGYSYITTIAKNWAREGILTVIQVEEKLKEQERSVGKLKDLMQVLNINKDASFEERQQFIKWQKEFGFDYNLILDVARRVRGKNSFNKLDTSLTKYNLLNLKTLSEIDEYENNKENIINITKEIVKKLGLYYENIENIIETYTNPWLNMGFGEKMLLSVAQLCLRQNIRTLEGMNIKLNQFFKLGILTNEHLNEYIGEIVSTDETIKKILETCGLTRLVNNFDRSMFRTWSFTWNFPLEVIIFACEKAKCTTNPMQYASKILSNWFALNLKTLEEVQKQNINLSDNAVSKNEYHQKDYSKQELDALFDNLDEVLGNVKK